MRGLTPGLALTVVGGLLPAVVYQSENRGPWSPGFAAGIIALSLGSFAAARWAETRRRRHFLWSVAHACAVPLAAFVLSLAWAGPEARMWAPIALLFGVPLWLPAMLCATLGARISTQARPDA